MLRNAALLALATAGAHAAVCSDRDECITSLPDAPEIDFYFAGGYEQVDNGRELYYWLQGSQSDTPDEDPLVLWLTGGPGCSSLSAALTEMGWAYPTANGSLAYNEFSWNQNANMLYLESPACVGFSTAGSRADCATNDTRTASDTREFLQAFIADYPEYVDRKFVITGESYAGHYAPNLAQLLLDEPVDGLNFEMMMVGNTWTDASWDMDGGAPYEALYGHYFISEETMDSLTENCADAEPTQLGFDNVKCQAATLEADKESGQFNGLLNSYDIFADVCQRSAVAERLMEHRGQTLGDQSDEPCIDNYNTAYLNRDEVQDAIHVTDHTRWSVCAAVSYEYAASSLQSWPTIIDSDVDVLIYSGDMDSVCPFPGTRAWTATLGMEQTEDWRPWAASDGQLGGFTYAYDRMTIATVRGAGHEVPTYQPRRAADLFNSYLTTKTVPSA